MKVSSYVKVALVAIPLALASCKHHKETPVQPKTLQELKDSTDKADFLQKVNQTAVNTQFVSSKVKFTVETGPQSLSLTGNLRMKRNDVIRLQLMAFGFVEAGRLEFTKDYVLIIDRINKLYLKAPYHHVDFLRNSGINFYTLQALFWGELFVPGGESVDSTMLDHFKTMKSEDEVVISLDQQEGRINYSWLAQQNTGRIKMTNIFYRDPLKGNSQLNWDYRNTSPLLGRYLFPSDMLVTLTTPKKEVKLGVKLTYLGNESEWEPRTVVSDKYRMVTVDEILQRFMAI